MAASAEICVDVWGDFAMFTRPDSKIERMTYNIPTPSACRGVLNAIYSKPKEFYYEITQIDIMKPIRTIPVRKNEVQMAADASKAKDPGYFIDTSEYRTQRMNTYLRDVYYRIHAKIIMQDNTDPRINIASLKDQFERRVSKGKCFFQPALGTRECMCYFSEPDMTMQPISESADFGIMLYDVFDITKDNSEKTLDTRKKSLNLCTCVSFFHAEMNNGIVKIPEWDSDEIYIKKGDAAHV